MWPAVTIEYFLIFEFLSVASFPVLMFPSAGNGLLSGFNQHQNTDGRHVDYSLISLSSAAGQSTNKTRMPVDAQILS